MTVDDRGPIAGIVLAAGMSRRLGRPKQLLDLNGKPLVMHVLERAMASQLDRVLVVTGHERERIASALEPVNVDLVFNPGFADGQSTSLIAGLRALAAETDAVVVLLGDQPLVSTLAISGLVERRRQYGDSIVMTGYGEIRSHPVLFGREVFGELLAINGDQGAREVIRRHSGEVVVIDSGEDAPPGDVDTEEAYARLLEEWARRN